MFEPLIGKSVRIKLNNPMKTHFGTETKTIFGDMLGESKEFVHIRTGFINSPGAIFEQQSLISKELVKSVDKEWLETVTKGNKEWFKPTETYIPARDD